MPATPMNASMQPVQPFPNNKALVFDTGPVISLTTSNLLWVLDYLKKHFQGTFFITPSVRMELVDHPLQTKKFKFEALQVQYRINKGVLTVVPAQDIQELAEQLFVLGNHSFNCQGHGVRIVSMAEMETLAWTVASGAQAAVIDERTTRLLIENPSALRDILQNNLGSDVTIERQHLDRFSDLTRTVRIIRSVELVIIAYERHILDRYLTKTPDDRKVLLESLLWNLKLHGCSVSREEIDRIVTLELHAPPTAPSSLPSEKSQPVSPL